MKQPAVQLSIFGLTAANVAAALLLLPLLNKEPVLIPPPKKLTPSSVSNSAAPTLKKVTRNFDPAAARLFTPQSLPNADDAARANIPAPKPETMLRLVGVILDEAQGGERIALVEYGQPGRVVRLHTGAQPNPTGWHVDEISTNFIALSRGNARKVLSLN